MQGIAILRKAAGLKQADLAAEVGVCRSAVAMWETDAITRRHPSFQRSQRR